MTEEQIIADCERKIAEAKAAIVRRDDPDEDMREIVQAFYDARELGACLTATPLDRTDRKVIKALRAVAPLLIAKFGWKKHDGSREAPEDAFPAKAACPIIITSTYPTWLTNDTLITQSFHYFIRRYIISPHTIWIQPNPHGILTTS